MTLIATYSYLFNLGQATQHTPHAPYAGTNSLRMWSVAIRKNLDLMDFLQIGF